MASKPPPHYFIAVDGEGDLTLRLYKSPEEEHDTTCFTSSLDPRKQIPGKVIATMLVTRSVLSTLSQSFKAEFTETNWMESAATTIDMEVDSVPAIELVMRCIHGTHCENEELYKIGIIEIWEALQYCSYRDVKVTLMKDWFVKWWEQTRGSNQKLEDDDIKMLLYPAYALDHAKAFAWLTRKLAYEMADHITEINPTRSRELHLDHMAIGAINGARGSLRSKMLRGLFNPVGVFLQQKCNCKEKSLFAYNMALSKTGLWPLHESHKKSVQDVLQSRGFVNFEPVIPEEACMKCRTSLEPRSIKTLRTDLLNNFHGLCLDCMTKTKGENVHEDYWNHDREKIWGSGCRIVHSQPTWYFSFMGRRTEMTKHQARERAKRDFFSGLSPFEM